MSLASDATPIFLIGLVLSLMAFPLASKRLSYDRLIIFFALLLVHVSASIAYYFYTIDYSADAPLYYYDRTGIGRSPFQLGTIFLIRFTQFFKNMIGGTYFDYFIIYQSFGFWGLILMMRTFEEIQDNLGMHSAATAALLFLPGLHFWTSAIGKDAPLFLSVCLAVWSMLALRRRLITLVIAIGIMVLLRPHIALVVVMSLALAAAIDGRTNPLVKISLLSFSIAAAVVIATTIQSTFDVRVSNADSVADFFARRNATFSKISGGTAVHGASFPFRMFSLLFRPFFIDANGIFAIVASFENVAFLAMLWFSFLNRHEALHLFRSVFFLKFVLIFAFLLILLLSMVYYNVGLGLRQRIMIMPALLCFFVAQLAYHQRVRTMRLAPAEAAA